MLWCLTATSLLTERFCWKPCKVKLLWEVSGCSFSQPGWKCHTLCDDFSCLPFPDGSHNTDQPRRRKRRVKEQWKHPPALPSLIQKFQSYPPKCIHKGICDSRQPPKGKGILGTALSFCLRSCANRHVRQGSCNSPFPLL